MLAPFPEGGQNVPQWLVGITHLAKKLGPGTALQVPFPQAIKMLRPPFKTSPAASQSTVYARFFKKLLPTSRQEKENKEILCCCRFSTNCEHDWGHLSLCTSVIPGFSLEGDGSGDIPKEAKNGVD